MAKWPEARRLMGTSIPRIDGQLKVSGAAKYSFDINLPGLLHAKVLRSPLAHGRIVSIDLGPAESMQGVKAVHLIKKPGDELGYAGDEIAAVAAVTEAIALDAVRAIQIKYQELDHVAREEDGLKLGPPVAQPGKVDERGENPDEVLKGAAAVIEGTYGCNVITHVCLETHGLVAQWNGDELTVWCSTQSVKSVADELRSHFNKPVTCITRFMGGGFGSKFNPDVWGIAACELAKKAGAPVKLMLDRAEEHNVAGNRPSQFARVRMGCDKEGKLTAIDAQSWGTGGHARDAGGVPIPYVYAVANRRRVHTNVFVNAGDQRAMRAPGHPQGALIMEAVMDDLCHKLDPSLDPVEFRLRNLPGGIEQPIWTRQLRLGAARIGWHERWHPRGDSTQGPWKRGLGCSLGRWGGGPGDAQATVTINPDGRVEVKCGTQDLGTGMTTLVPLVAAEILGLEIRDIQGSIGSSALPPAGGSGGSTSTGGVSAAVGAASMKALEELKKAVAADLGTQPEELVAMGRRIHQKGDPEKGFTWRQACARIGAGKTITATASRDDPLAKGLTSSGVGGAQFADVSVDVETGFVHLNKIVAVADCGLVVNRLTCESQVFGGVVMGLNYALHEERRLDRQTGLPLNPDMENYRLASAGDIPEIEVHLLDYPERGVIGIGEPPTIPTAAAISNAVANATGARVPVIPLTPARVLSALAAQEKGKA
jgi:xanthine dehydrogenase YagR molybdenum-binding subunit